MPDVDVCVVRCRLFSGRVLHAALARGAMLIGAMAAGIAAAAEPGVYPDRIVIGQSTGVTGPLASTASSCMIGAKAYFSDINAQGGIHGRRIELQTRDDGYDARAALANTEDFIRGNQVLALFGYSGWPGVEASLPVISRARVPFLFPCSGASPLYANLNRYVFTIRASYAREYSYLFRLFGRFGVRSVVTVFQDDRYGARLLSEIESQPAARSVSMSSVEISAASNVPTLVARMMALRPDAVLLVNGDSGVNAALVRGLREVGYQGRFFGASVIGQRALADALGQLSRGVVVTQVVPSPWHFSIPLVVDYRRLMDSHGLTAYSFGSMEGFIAARVLVEALRRAGRNLSREKLIEALESINEENFAHRGFPVNFSSTNHQGSNFVDTALMAGDALFVN